jgi:hypothetical protein
VCSSTAAVAAAFDVSIGVDAATGGAATFLSSLQTTIATITINITTNITTCITFYGHVSRGKSFHRHYDWSSWGCGG